MDRNIFKKDYRILTILSILFISIVRFFYISFLPLSADEAYLWVCSRHLALSFYDTPPFAPYMIFISTKLFGNTEFSVRAFVVVFMALTSYLGYIFGKEVSGGDKKVAFITALLILIIPGYTVAGLLAGVEAPLLFFYLLSVYFLYLAIVKKKPSNWYLAGISTGLGFLSKYLILFIPFCLFFYLLLTDKRKYFKTIYPYLFLLISFIVSLPVFIWNIQNQWASFLLNFFSRTRSEHIFSINFLNFLKHIGAQAGIISPFVLIIILYGLWMMFIKRVFKKDEKILFLTFFSTPILLFFALYSLFIEIPAPHWVGTAYLPLLVGLPTCFFAKERGIGIKRFFLFSFLSSIFITSLILSLPLMKNFLFKIPFESGVKNDFELYLSNFPSKVGNKLGKIKSDIPDKDNYFFIGRGFALASYLEFYNPKQEEVYMIFQRTKVGHGYYFWQDINEKKGLNAIFVDEDERCENQLKTLFDKVEKVEDYHIYNLENEVLDTYLFYDCKNFKGMSKEKPPVLKRFGY